MFATAHTTRAALEMIFFSEDNKTFFAHVIIFGVEIGFENIFFYH